MNNKVQLNHQSRDESKHHKTIIHVASYHRGDFDLAFIKIPSSDNETVRGPISQPFSRPGSATLGALDSLPVEIVHGICRHMDICSLFKFRQVNLHAREFVHAVREYRLVSLHFPNGLKAIFKTNLALWFTIRDLFTLVCTPDCSNCSSFGSHVFLPSLKRCCLSCLESAPKFRIILLAEASRLFCLSSNSIRKSLPVLGSLPGIYSMRGLRRIKRSCILSEEDAIRLFGNRNPRALRSPIGRVDLTLTYMASIALPYLDTATGDIQNGVCCKGCQIVFEEAACVSWPNEDMYLKMHVRRDRIYSNAEFLEHFRECAEAQSFWNSSHQSTISFEEPRDFRRGVYYHE